MRLAAQEKMGFYPAATEAITELVKHLVPPTEPTYILDPCAGEGAAIKQIAESFALPEDHVYCIELDNGRGNAVRQSMPKAQVLSPCSFFSTSMMPSSFGLVYCNPPFDDKLGGGGREELDFTRACYRLLVPNGVLVLVAPFRTFQGNDLCIHLDCFYKDSQFYAFPDDYRRYNECVFIGVKRNVPIGSEAATNGGLMLSALRMSRHGNLYRPSQLATLGKPQFKWERGRSEGEETELHYWGVPKCREPLRFAKAGYTDEELIDVIADSKINDLVLHVDVPAIREPPLPLERGHVAMLLAAGALDGLVETPEGNHVVRGVAMKIEVYNEEASDYTVSADGESAKIKEVYSQQITLKVRALDRNGTIFTFTTDQAVASVEDKITEADVDYKDWELIQKLKKVIVANGATPGEEQAAKARLRAVMERVSKNPTTKTGTNG